MEWNRFASAGGGKEQVMGRPKVGFFGLTGCAGDQLVVLNCEDELLRLVELLDVRDFLMATSANDRKSRLDIAFVEGAVVGSHDEAKLQRIRARSDALVALGTCAMWGGIPALDRDEDRPALVREIYGPVGCSYATADARALHQVVTVELGIPGCPIEKSEFLAAVAHLLQGDPPPRAEHPVCTDCRLRELPCFLLDRGIPCLGALTAGGCGALCVGLGVACIGCRGPAVGANPASGYRTLLATGVAEDALRRRLNTFGPQLPEVPARAGGGEWRDAAPIGRTELAHRFHTREGA
jgi:sulfhydrogenase subunit delta